MAWMILWVFLYGFIPVVGPIIAIVKAYAYRLTPYILVLEPDVKITDAIHVSEERTRGFKGKMFGADILAAVLYFLLYIAVIITVAIVSYILPMFAPMFALAATLVIMFVAIVLPLFLGLVQAAFYEEIMAVNAPKTSDEEEAPAAETETV
jgi:uncharacterized membrane protein